jgi:hypothetical protein
MSDQPPLAIPGVVASVIDLAKEKAAEATTFPVATTTMAKSTSTAEAPAGGAPIDRVKAVTSLVVVGFAGVMSYIGLQGTDLTTVMRNQSLLVQFMGLFLLLAVVTAILSIFVRDLGTGRFTFGMELGIIFGQFALFPLIEAITPIPFITSQAQTTAGWAVAAALAIVGFALFVASMPQAESARPDGAGTGAPGSEAGALIRTEETGTFLEPGHRSRSGRLLHRPADQTHFYIFLLVVSLLFTAVAIYTGLRLEVRNQLAVGVGLQANLQQTGSHGVVTLDVSASRLAAEDFVVVNVTALESHPSITSACGDVPTVPGDYSCAADPCSSNYPNAARYCDSLVGWDVPPDAAGNVDRQLTFPFSTATYQRLHIETYTCERSTLKTAAVCDLGQSNHIDLAVPSR